VLVAACGGSSSSSPADSAGAVGSAAPGGGYCESASLTASIPTKVNDVVLQTTGANALVAYGVASGPLYNLTLMIGDLGTTPASTCVAGGADQDGKLQIIAAQFKGASSSAIQTEIEKVAKQADPNVALANVAMGGKQVTTATFPGSQVAPIVAYITGDTLYYIEASDATLSAAAVQALP
jgi:hypothetical protein